MAKNEEDLLQAACYKWFSETHRTQHYGRLFMNLNNPPNVVRAGQLIAMGLVKGIADMSFLLPRGRVAYIELKTTTGTQEKEQKQFQALCKSLDIPYYLIRSENEFKELITDLLSWT